MPRNQFNLTEREKEILQLIYEGYTDNEIAKALDISKNTVRTHRENLPLAPSPTTRPDRPSPAPSPRRTAR